MLLNVLIFLPAAEIAILLEAVRKATGRER